MCCKIHIKNIYITINSPNICISNLRCVVDLWPLGISILCLLRFVTKPKMANRMAGVSIRVLLAPNRCTLFTFEGMHARELVHHSDIATQCAQCVYLSGILVTGLPERIATLYISLITCSIA